MKRSRAHHFVLQISIIDEDEEGDSIREFQLDPAEWYGYKNFSRELPQYLHSLDEFLANHQEELNSPPAEAPEE